MAADDKIEELIREIAAKHAILVGRNDPIFVLQTINERLMRDSSEAQEAIVAKFREDIEEVSARWSDDAKAKAERTLNAALTASKEAMSRALADGAKATAEAIRKETERAAKEVASAASAVKGLAYAALVGGLFTMGSVVFLMVTLRHS
jgi:hypothetical protein